MVLYKRDNLIFFFVIFLWLQNVILKSSYNNYAEFPENKSKLEEKNFLNRKEDGKDEIISLNLGNNKLKIKLEVYNIYLYFLIILNILFLISLIIYIIYKKFFDKKENNSEDIKKEILLENINEKNSDNNVEKNNEINSNYIIEELYKNINDENQMIDEEYLNNSGLEAPPASKINKL